MHPPLNIYYSSRILSSHSQPGSQDCTKNGICNSGFQTMVCENHNLSSLPVIANNDLLRNRREKGELHYISEMGNRWGNMKACRIFLILQITVQVHVITSLELFSVFYALTFKSEESRMQFHWFLSHPSIVQCWATIWKMAWIPHSAIEAEWASDTVPAQPLFPEVMRM